MPHMASPMRWPVGPMSCITPTHWVPCFSGAGMRFMPDHPLRREGLLVQACVRMTGAAGRPFIHDPLDGVSAAATLGAAAEAGIDLAHAGPLRLFCNH